jgi:uncharacterized protein YcbX
MMLGRVAEIWRYPVNGLQGEKLVQARVIATGISGDHLYALRDSASGKVLDPKSYSFSWGESLGKPTMLALSARLSGEEGGQTLSIEESGSTICSTGDPDVDERISASLGAHVELVPYPRFAEARVRSGRTLHLITTGSLDRMNSIYPQGNFDVRRFRPNIVVATEPGLDGFPEGGWLGKELELGGVRILVEKPNERCRVTTMAQPGIVQDPGILETIQRENASNLGVLGRATVEGSLHVGDPVSLADGPN